MTISRRTFCNSALGFALSAFFPSANSFANTDDLPQLGDPTPFSPDTITDLAQKLSRQPYTARPSVPPEWQNLTYDQYKSIWFNERKALWTGSSNPYRVDLFSPGLYFPKPIQISIVESGESRPLKFDFSLFDHTDKIPDLPIDDTLGYSGFRLRSQLEKPGIYQEYCVFQGASYFRAIAKGQIYGLSARGLAVNTATPAGEEFPDFTHFWIESPTTDTITIHALLDSPSVSGAYRFIITPSDDTIMDVQCTLFPRVDLTHLGIAPLTSMFLFDETNRHRFNDFRPAVHDNDGLQILNANGEVLWRPLANPERLQNSFFVDNVSGIETPITRGFGLMQRPRKFSDYADLEALYHRRPGLWVEPSENWGSGSVQLVEIPADREIYDNIVAFWRPRSTLPAGSYFNFSYRLRWGESPYTSSVARVINTRIGKRFTGGYIITVDFEDHPSLRLPAAEYTQHIRSPHVAVSEGILQRNPETGGLRLAFAFDPSDRNFAELRCQLRHSGSNVSEVWLYRWTL